MLATTLESAARVVQLALTPIFLLSAVAALLNVLAARFGRVADQTDALAGRPEEEPGRASQLRMLLWRSRASARVVVLAALAGALTYVAVLVLFLGEVRGAGAANLLFLLFGGAIALTMEALVAFVVEMLLPARGVRRMVHQSACP